MEDGFLDVTGINKAKKFFAIKKFNSLYNAQTKKIDNELKSIEDLTEQSISFLKKSKKNGLSCENYDKVIIGAGEIKMKNQDAEIVSYFDNNYEIEKLEVKKFNSNGKLSEYSKVDFSSGDKVKTFEKYNSNGDLMFKKERVYDESGYVKEARLECSQDGEILNMYKYLVNDEKKHFTTMLNKDKSNSYIERIQDLDKKIIEKEETIPQSEGILPGSLMPRVDKYGQIRNDIKSDDRFVKYCSEKGSTFVYPSIKFKTNSETYEIADQQLHLPEGLNDKKGKLIVKISDNNEVNDIKFKDFETNKWYEIKDDKILELENYTDDYRFVDNYYLKSFLVDDMANYIKQLPKKDIDDFINKLNNLADE